MIKTPGHLLSRGKNLYLHMSVCTLFVAVRETIKYSLLAAVSHNPVFKAINGNDM